MISHLQSAGHTVKVASYDRGYRNLRDDFDVFETEGLTIGSADNRVSVVQTFVDNLSRLSEGVRKLRELRTPCGPIQPVAQNRLGRHEKQEREGGLQRNFQGYSTHRQCDMIALGVSGIGGIETGNDAAGNDRRSRIAV